MSHSCYHCGADTADQNISLNGHFFCCDGCKFVYGLLKENDLCDYYSFDQSPGLKAKGKFEAGRFAYLDNEEIISKLTRFRDGTQMHVMFNIPQMHCASCIWLLENLHRANPAVIRSTVDFTRKELFMVFEPEKISLRKLVELLAYIGYEPYISFQDMEDHSKRKFDRAMIYKIGVAGFCFGNIMMLSLPEYLSFGEMNNLMLKHLFSYLSLALSLPVLIYSSSEFYVSAWKGLRQKYLNIDLPIVLAIVITFTRSFYEIVSGTGSGYLDSMSGIVFFMLVGRIFQNRTYDSLSFDRDFKSYFPLGVSRLIGNDEIEESIPVSQLQKGDMILVRNEGTVPADAILTEGEASIDYSFVTGESIPVSKRKGELIYAGGRQLGGIIKLEVIQAVSQSYLTQLWNNSVFSNEKNAEQSFIHPLARNFTFFLLILSAAAGIYWAFADPARSLNAITAILIVACPCALLLSATFTNGSVLRIMGMNRFYLKNASVIESISAINTVVFDKTGTLTVPNETEVQYVGKSLGKGEFDLIGSIASHSSHPLSRSVSRHLAVKTPVAVKEYKESSGKGIEATVAGHYLSLGSSEFVNTHAPEPASSDTGTAVHVSIDHDYKGKFFITNRFREETPRMVSSMKEMGYSLFLLSGDTDKDKPELLNYFKSDSSLHFRQSPEDKMTFVSELQNQKSRVMMLGDGLNDSGALRKSDVGIAVTENTNFFTPASDAILDAKALDQLPSLLRFAKSTRYVILGSFVISVLYNVVGLYFAVQGTLKPVIAAILMPCSTLSIVLFTVLATRIYANWLGLEVKDKVGKM